MPLEEEWQPTPVPLPGESLGQRSLAGFSPWGHKELDTALHAHMPLISQFFMKICVSVVIDAAVFIVVSVI